MKLFFSIFVILSLKVLMAQDTTYFSEYQLAKQEYNKLSQKLGKNKILLDRAVMLEMDKILSLKSNYSPSIDAKDWLYMYHAKNLASVNQDLKNKVNELTLELFDFIYINSNSNKKLTLPIGIVDFNAYNVKPDKYTDGTLSFSNGWNYQGQNPNLIFDENRYSLTSILSDETFINNELRLELNSNYIFEENKKIKHVKITYAGQKHTLKIGESIDLFLNENDTIFYFETVFKNNESTFNSQIIKVNLPPTTTNKSLIIPPFEIPYTDDSDPEIAGLTLNYNVLYGTCNTTFTIQKPIIMLHGYRPPIQNGSLAPSLIELFAEKFNFKGSEYGGDGFCELLAKNGYDVIICRIDPAHNSIIAGGKLMKSFITNFIEPQKQLFNSKFETVVLGFSMGGQFWRSALMQMESEHFFANGENHHVRMWIPVDSPNEGANIPLAHQWAARSLWANTSGAPVFNIAYNGLLTQGSKEQLRYHFDGIHGNDGADHYFHSGRVNFLSILNNDFYLGESLTKYRGYPSATRNVAIAVGSNSDDDYTDLSAGDLTWGDDSHVFGLLSHKKWDVKLYAEKNQTNQLLFKRVVTRKPYLSNSTNILVNDFVFTDNLIEMDNCYGSYHNKIRETINDGLDWNSLLGFNDYDYDGNQVFVPTVSALAINPREWPTNMRYNLKTNGLMFNNLNDDINDFDDASNYFGYPHLGRSNDYQNLTPMNAIFCDDKTYEHITLINDEDGQNDQSELISFLLNEIEPWYLDLQNQNLGEYARNDYEYKAKYRAKNVIKTGNNLSPKTPFGDYNIQANANLDLEAGVSIEFKPGTHIKQGAKVHAYIWLNYCEPSGINVTNSNNLQHNYFLLHENSKLDQDTIKDYTSQNSIYPNPNDGTFTINCDELGDELGELQIYNLQGVLVDKIKLKNKQQIKLNNFQKNNLFIARILKNEIILCETKISIL